MDHYFRFHKHYFYELRDVTTPGAGSVHLYPIQIPVTSTVDRIIFDAIGGAVGNVRACIYEDNGDTPVGGAVIVETASVAVGVVNTRQEVAIAATQLDEGAYWIAFQHDDAGFAARGIVNAGELGGTWEVNDYVLVYGPFTDPCPATAQNNNLAIAMSLRVASVP